MKRLWMLLLIMAVTLLLAGSIACGGDDDDDGGDSNATATVAGDDGGDDEETDEPTDDAGDDGGDDGGDDDDYYNQLETIFDSADQETNAISQQYSGPYDDTADEIEQTTAAFSETGAVLEGVIESMSDLDIPIEAQDAHDSYVASVGSATSLFAVSVLDLGEISTAEELTAFQDEVGPDLSAAVDDIEAQCLVLQGLADDAGSDADLGCSRQD